MKKIITGILYGIGAAVGVVVGIALLWFIIFAVNTPKTSQPNDVICVNGVNYTPEEFSDYMAQNYTNPNNE